jgi:hypothetical protein
MSLLESREKILALARVQSWVLLVVKVANVDEDDLVDAPGPCRHTQVNLIQDRAIAWEVEGDH